MESQSLITCFIEKRNAFWFKLYSNADFGKHLYGLV